jgi:hypothetical protein
VSYENVQKVQTTQPILVEYYVGLRLSVGFGYRYKSYLMAIAICLGEFFFKQLLLCISVRIHNIHTILILFLGVDGVW